MDRPNHSSAVGVQETNNDRLISVAEILQIILRRWFWGASLAVVAACVFLFFVLTREKEYEAIASVTVELSTENVMNIREVVDTQLPHASLLDSFMNTQVERVKTRSITEAVVDSLSEEELDRLIAPYSKPPEEREADAPAVNVVRMIQERMLDVKRGNTSESQVIYVVIRHRDPEIAQVLANAFIDQFISYKAGLRNISTSNAVNFLSRQLGQMEEKLKASESALQDFRLEHHLVSVEQGKGVGVERMRRLGDAVTDARIRLLEAENRARQIQECEGNLGRLMEIPFVGGRREIMDAYNKLNDLRRERKVLEETYLSRHPRIVENQASQRSVTEALRQVIAQTCNQIASEYKSIEHELDSLIEKFQAAEQDVLKRERVLVEYQRLDNEIESQKHIIDMLSDRYNETSISKEMDLRSVRVLDRAELPNAPVTASLLKLGAVAAFLSGIIFVAVPLGMEFLDHRLTSFADIEAHTGKVLLADVRFHPEKDFHELSQAVLRRDADLIEAFRALYSRVLLQSAVGKNRPIALLVTSSLPGEGKSMVAGNLASAFANHNYRVLLVDCDLRRPTLQAAFDQGNQRGLITWYQSGTSAEAPSYDPMQDESLGILAVAPNLFLLTTGGQSDESTEILGSKKVETLFARFKREFDVVIFDTPPVGLFPDATLVANSADECIFVAGQFKATRQKVRYSITLMDRTSASVLGVVFNCVKDINAAIGYGNKSRSYYGYGVEKNVRKYSDYYNKRKA